jgi:ribosomal protein S18 acetylase RimI-like enzyme
MPVSSRSYRHEEDFQQVMSFLREAYIETGNLDNWLPPRFENSAEGMAADTRVWETQDEHGRPRILAVANPETRYVYFIQVCPGFGVLLDEALDWVEGHCSLHGPETGELRVSVVALEGSIEREAALRRHGFQRGRVYGVQRIRDVDAPIPGFKVPDGFKLRSVRPGDFQEIAGGVRAVFGHGEWFTAEILEKTSRKSFYHEDLDLVAVDPHGKIASFCTFRLDSPSGITELEPMGTLPEYRGRGLAKALLCEGFRRLEKYDPKLLYIDGAADTPAANRLYEATGFTVKHNYHYWDKAI